MLNISFVNRCLFLFHSLKIKFNLTRKTPHIILTINNKTTATLATIPMQILHLNPLHRWEALKHLKQLPFYVVEKLRTFGL